MPKLKAYTDGSAKSGHYILANVGGAHPITLQVTDLGEQILKKAGYGDDDAVPTKVVWSMFEIGILYTSGAINDPPETMESPDETFAQLGVANKLTPEEQEQLTTYLDEYTGPNQDEVETLRASLETTTTESNKSKIPESARADLDRLARLHDNSDLTDEEYELLKSRVLDDLPTAAGTTTSAGSDDDVQFDPDAVPFDLASELWSLVPDGKYDDAGTSVVLNDTTSEASNTIHVSYFPDGGGFLYQCIFYEQSHEDRMWAVLEGDSWELLEDDSDQDFAPSVMIQRTDGKAGYRDDLPSGYVEEEIQYLLQLAQRVYQTAPENLVVANRY